MSIGKPFVALINEVGTNHWKIELHDLKAIRDKLGADAFKAFCCCFVHADRLTSLISFDYASMKQYGEASLIYSRNLQTVFWFAVGTLRELARAIRALRSALAKSGMLDPKSEPWRALGAAEARWEGNPFYRDIRNKVAFHVDPEVINKGLIAMEAEGKAILCEAEGTELDQLSMCLGPEALFNGLGKSRADFVQFIKTVSEDHGISSTIQEAFILALETSGISFRKFQANA